MKIKLTRFAYCADLSWVSYLISLTANHWGASDIQYIPLYTNYVDCLNFSVVIGWLFNYSTLSWLDVHCPVSWLVVHCSLSLIGCLFSLYWLIYSSQSLLVRCLHSLPWLVDYSSCLALIGCLLPLHWLVDYSPCPDWLSTPPALVVDYSPCPDSCLHFLPWLVDYFPQSLFIGCLLPLPWLVAYSPCPALIGCLLALPCPDWLFTPPALIGCLLALVLRWSLLIERLQSLHSILCWYNLTFTTNTILHPSTMMFCIPTLPSVVNTSYTTWARNTDNNFETILI